MLGLRLKPARPQATAYIVQSFQLKGRKLTPDPIKTVKTARPASRWPNAWASTRPGSFAFSQEVDIETDTYDEPARPAPGGQPAPGPAGIGTAVGSALDRATLPHLGLFCSLACRSRLCCHSIRHFSPPREARPGCAWLLLATLAIAGYAMATWPVEP